MPPLLLLILLELVGAAEVLELLELPAALKLPDAGNKNGRKPDDDDIVRVRVRLFARKVFTAGKFGAVCCNYIEYSTLIMMMIIFTAHNVGRHRLFICSSPLFGFGFSSNLIINNSNSNSKQ